MDVLDILKGLMILFIIITHHPWTYPDDYLRYGFVFYIDMAVPVFMIISGYLAAISYEKKKTSLSGLYTVDVILPKVIRFAIPFLIAFLIEIPFFIYIEYGLSELIGVFLRGGYGPGSYYTPVMIQFIFITPIIFYIIKKHDFFGVCICFLFTSLWEAVHYSWGAGDYSLHIFRYVSLIAFGCFIAIGKTVLSRNLLFAMYFAGITWQIILCYFGIKPVFMNEAWAHVNYLSSLMVMPLVYVLIKNLSSNALPVPILQIMGKASYNIYLVQMVYYGCGLRSVAYGVISAVGVQLVFSVVFCCTIGIIFYLVENRITRFIIKKIKARDYFKPWLCKLENKCNRVIND